MSKEEDIRLMLNSGHHMSDIVGIEYENGDIIIWNDVIKVKNCLEKKNIIKNNKPIIDVFSYD